MTPGHDISRGSPSASIGGYGSADAGAAACERGDEMDGIPPKPSGIVRDRATDERSVPGPLWLGSASPGLDASRGAVKAGSGGAGGVPSRQAIQQRELKKKGLCVKCWQPARHGRGYCPACNEKARLYSRARTNSKPWHEGGPGRPPIGRKHL